MGGGAKDYFGPGFFFPGLNLNFFFGTFLDFVFSQDHTYVKVNYINIDSDLESDSPFYQNVLFCFVKRGDKNKEESKEQE